MRNGPRIFYVTPNQMKPEGSNVTLSCKFETVDEETTYWWYHGQEEKNSSLYSKALVKKLPDGLEVIEHMLTIKNVSREDQGEYRCRARNKIKPSDTLKTYLTVTTITGQYLVSV